MDLTRRQAFQILAAGGVAASTLSLVANAQVVSNTPAGPLSMPGPFKGKVVAVKDAKSYVEGRFQQGPIRTMIRRGMMELTGAPDWQSAWRKFFDKSDVVGVKFNPVGKPAVIGSREVFAEIFAGLEACGIPRKNIVAYDRYRSEFYGAGFDKWLPEGVRVMWAAEAYDDVQHSMNGYDPNHYFDMALTVPGHPVNTRSCAAKFISQEVNKLVNVPLLKDHASAGVTLALKNISHGLVNNVARSHSTRTLNACGAFIPTAVSLPTIRHKAVLHILDGIKAMYHDGPQGIKSYGENKHTFEHHTMYFATDPVALDTTCAPEIDKVRVAKGLKTVYETIDPGFVRRQPEHIEIAGALGLGEADPKKINVIRVNL
jgi:hypothetical protein